MGAVARHGVCSAFGGSYQTPAPREEGSTTPIAVETFDAPFLVKIMSLIHEVMAG